MNDVKNYMNIKLFYFEAKHEKLDFTMMDTELFLGSAQGLPGVLTSQNTVFFIQIKPMTYNDDNDIYDIVFIYIYIYFILLLFF